MVRDQDGHLIKFGDIAHIKVGPETTDSAMRVDGKTAVGLGVYAVATANPIAADPIPSGVLIYLWNLCPVLKAYDTLSKL